MTSYQFQSSLYRTERDMLDAIVAADLSSLTASGEIDDYLSYMTPWKAARECIADFGLRELDEYGGCDGDKPVSHMTKYGYRVRDLAEAFKRFAEARKQSSAA
jgi:hypothetical protein